MAIKNIGFIIDVTGSVEEADECLRQEGMYYLFGTLSLLGKCVLSVSCMPTNAVHRLSCSRTIDLKCLCFVMHVPGSKINNKTLLYAL